MEDFPLLRHPSLDNMEQNENEEIPENTNEVIESTEVTEDQISIGEDAVIESAEINEDMNADGETTTINENSKSVENSDKIETTGSGEETQTASEGEISSQPTPAQKQPDTNELFYDAENELENMSLHHPEILALNQVLHASCSSTKQIVQIFLVPTIHNQLIENRENCDIIEEIRTLFVLKKVTQNISYCQGGNVVKSLRKDKSLGVIDTQNSALKHHIKDAHESPIFSFCPIDDYLCATGDDDGTVKIWDFRKRKSVFEFKCGEQTITSLLCDERKKTLVASVSDGSIAGFNIRGKKLEVQSEMYESELTSLCLVRGGTRLVVGSGEGTMYIFNWGEFGFHIDNFPGHPDQVHCMVPITDRMLLTGCEDGIIRAVHLYGHRFVGVVGQHKDFGVENMSVSCDGSLLASCAMDEVVRFWNVEYLYDIEVDDRKKGDKKKDKENNLESSKRRNHGDFFKDIPSVVESDDESGPVAGPSNVQD
ncbi:unnamed protein product, partial [Meganyctiphanes norvegica]